MHVAGYSWKTNQYGLTVDSVTEFHLVTPNGTELIVSFSADCGQKRLWKRDPHSVQVVGSLQFYSIVRPRCADTIPGLMVPGRVDDDRTEDVVL
jgi:hypothetical protein